LLELSYQATIDDLTERLRVALAEIDELADMVRKGFP
jgi:hypothetical protein